MYIKMESNKFYATFVNKIKYHVNKNMLRENEAFNCFLNSCYYLF